MLPRLTLLSLTFLALSWEPVSAKPDWRTVADERIEKYRKGDLQLLLVDASGEPLTNTPVSLKLVRHAFGFGTCINGWPWKGGNPNEKAYSDFITSNFNSIVLEDHMKWYHVEKERGLIDFSYSDQLVDWAISQGLSVRGHNLLWAKEKWTPKWVRKLSPEELRKAVLEHVKRTVTHYRGRVIAWDVNNEMLDGSFYRDRLGEDIIPQVFKTATDADPHTPLYVNEYGILASDDKTQRYLALIENLQKQGAAVGGIGVQEHAGERFVRSAPHEATEPERREPGELKPEEVWKRLDMLAETGLPIWLTEVSFKTPDKLLRAEALERLFLTVFAHPAVDGVMLWGFWQNRHWLGADAALIGRDWTMLPAGRSLVSLLNKRWTTDLKTATDSDGKVSFRGFYGAYEVTIEGKSEQTPLLERTQKSATIMFP